MCGEHQWVDIRSRECLTQEWLREKNLQAEVYPLKRLTRLASGGNDTRCIRYACTECRVPVTVLFTHWIAYGDSRIPEYDRICIE